MKIGGCNRRMKMDSVWKVKLFFKVMKNEIENKILRRRIKKAWVKMAEEPEELDHVKIWSSGRYLD